MQFFWYTDVCLSLIYRNAVNKRALIYEPINPHFQFKLRYSLLSQQ